MDYKNLSIPSLIERCVSKDPLAWTEFVRRFSPLLVLSIKKALLRYSIDSCGAEQEIKDIQQDIMISLWNKNRLDEVKNRENINYWLVIIARNATINHLKAKRKEVLVRDASYFEKLPAKIAGHQTSEVAIENLDRKIKEIYSLLPPKEKIIFKLYFKKGLALRDISNMINMPLGTVSSIITRIRQKVKYFKK